MRREGAVRRLTGSQTLPQDGAALAADSIHTSNKAETFKLHRLWMQAWLQKTRLLSCASSWSGCRRRTTVCCEPCICWTKILCLCVAGAHFLFDRSLLVPWTGPLPVTYWCWARRVSLMLTGVLDAGCCFCKHSYML